MKYWQKKGVYNAKKLRDVYCEKIPRKYKKKHLSKAQIENQIKKTFTKSQKNLVNYIIETKYKPMFGDIQFVEN